MRNLHLRKGLDDPKQVLLHQRVLQAAEVRGDDRVIAQLGLIIYQHTLQVLQRARRVRRGHRLHGVKRLSLVLESALGRNEARHVIRLAAHHLAHKHVLKRHHCTLVVLQVVELFEALEEVGVRSFVVFLLGVKDAALHVDHALHRRRHVDGVGVGACRRQRRLALGHIAKGVVYPTLQQVDVHQQQLVVQLFDFKPQGADEPQRLLKALHVQVQRGQPQFNSVAQERPLLRLSPRHLLLAQLHLQRVAARHGGERVDDVAHNFRRLGLGHKCKKGSELREERLERRGVLEFGQQLGKLVNGLLLDLDAVGI
mmetsp:Transcript_35401/g.88561  ORF Transcript_35401/g.88561 Transcript_35401/m.88561 type:complete len:312 (+) Transcript_35401:342-1277(+)